ncbi:zona pellucida sperm-binding protein 1 [Alligator mississippiensis]|uniref:Zona pellucida sperm-binding protein 1 n=1 Tax=Alligator mississippiensis TaxID=8496 RepID=A0A151NZ16_ALLMI|nr:zona pellucida sperm-binding protein 1 [Alligator mississippiensis]
MRLGYRCLVALVLFFLGTAQRQDAFLRISFSVLQHRYDCGDYGMQLVVYPSQGYTIHFKVMDEFGTSFEVTNCSICLHWITTGWDGAVVFSTGYDGCHVLKKDGRNYLRVHVEELQSTGEIATTLNVNMICPKPTEHDSSSEGNVHSLPQPSLQHPAPPPGLVHLVPSNIGSHLTWQQCQVPAGKIPCADTPGRAACLQAGCCYNEIDRVTPCYYGNTATVQCLMDGHFILVVSRDMSEYPIKLDTVRLAYAQAECNPIHMTEAFVMFRFPFTQCGTTVQLTRSKLIYENQLISSIDVKNGPYGGITRDSIFILHARCIFNTSNFLPVQAEVSLPPSLPPVSEAGPLLLELRIATDGTYSTYYVDGEYPVLKVLKDPVYVEVRTLERTDPSLVLLLEKCWATPSANPLEQPQWPILVNGCPFMGDNYRTQLVPTGSASSELPFPTHYQRFVISTFAFVDTASTVALGGPVYLFCSASACHPSQLEPCRPICSNPRLDRVRRYLNTNNGTEKPLDLVSSHGPVIFQGIHEPRRERVYENEDVVSRTHPSPVFLGALALLVMTLLIALLLLYRRRAISAMWLGCRCFIPLVLLISLGRTHGQLDFHRVTHSFLQYKYDCGDYTMQLLVFPSWGHTIQFKVLDEFGTPFEVSNCSICRHWISSGEGGAVIFSAGYDGCRVLKKDSRHHLRVRVEELLSTGIIMASYDVNMTCPKLIEYDSTLEDNLRSVSPPSLVYLPQPGFVHPMLQPQPHPSLVRPVPLFYTSTQAGAQLTWEQCRVAAGKIPCGTTPGRAACLQAGCCYDETDRMTPCYYGNTATVQCLMDGQFILVISRHMSEYPINLDSVRIAYAQAGCDPIRMTEAFVMFQFPFTQCGTTVQVIGDKLVYENQLISSIEVRTGPRGSITRDSTYILHARCIYNASDFLPLQVEVLMPPTQASVAQFGPLRLQLRIATDETYSGYYVDREYPVVKVLRDPIYVEVRILQRTDPSLVLALHQCWATPTTNPMEHPQWPILVDGCPFSGDNYRTQLVPMGSATAELPFPNHYQRFIISTFTFVDTASYAALKGEVYIFCSASICHLSQPEPCRPTCQSGATARARRSLRTNKEKEKHPNLRVRWRTMTLSSA